MSLSTSTLFSGIQYVWFGISIYLIILLTLTQTQIFKKALDIKQFTTREYILYTILFTIMGIFGTFWNFKTAGGIMTFRAISVILSGYIGGPVVGAITGLNVGLIRSGFLHNTLGPISGVLTILQGIVAGQLSMFLKKKQSNICYWTLIFTCVLEFFYWLLYAILSWPFAYSHPHDFLSLAIPVMLTNIPPVIFFVWILQSSQNKKDTETAKVTNNTFNSINTLLDQLNPKKDHFDTSVIPQIITSSLSNIIWAAVIYDGFLYTSSNYQNTKQELQGQTEIAILSMQHSIPSLSHIFHINARHKEQTILEIYVSAPASSIITDATREFLQGLCRVFELIYDRDFLKDEELLLQEAEIKALQAQINPHFLYNTLNTIRFYTRSDPETARNLINYLSDYYRFTLNNPSKLIPLNDELHDIKCYMELEKARFGDRLNIEYRIPEDLKTKIKIPPLLLQPLVENSVLHGILKKENGGHIIIGLHEHPKFYRIFVKDDGIGIARPKLKGLLANRKKKNHIGLNNVENRLKAIFGTDSKFKILSIPSKGTIVYMDIPKVVVSSHDQVSTLDNGGDNR